MPESSYYLAIALAFFGFVTLAFVLLYPIYRFIRREEEQSRQWTTEALAQRQRQALEDARRADASGDGSAGGEGGPGEPPDLHPGG